MRAAFIARMRFSLAVWRLLQLSLTPFFTAFLLTGFFAAFLPAGCRHADFGVDD